MLGEMFFPMNIIPNVSFLRWAQEAFYITEIRSWQDVYQTEQGMSDLGYSMDNYQLDVFMVLAFGLFFRLCAFVTLIIKDRSKWR